MNLYEIDQRLLNLEMLGVDTETGEVAVTEEDFQRMYDEIQMEMNDKLINTSCFIKNLMADIEAFKAEEKRIAERRKRKEALVAHLKESMDNVIKHRLNDIDNDFDGCNAWKLDDPKAYISYRKSEKVNIIDETKIPKAFLKVKTEPNLTEIKNAIKDGKKVKGAEIVTNLNLQIK